MRGFCCALAGLFFLSGCVGPTAIRTERLDFSEAIAKTSREQLLLNLVRVHFHEQPQFTDVSSITNTSQLNGSFGATFNLPQNVGVNSGNNKPYYSGHDYSPTFSISSYDQPAITYSPLIGSALVNQIAQPISVDSLAALIDSDWPIGPLLEFTVDRLSLTPLETPLYLDCLADLQANRVLSFTAVKSAFTPGTLDDTILVLLNTDQLNAIKDDVERERLQTDWEVLAKAFRRTYIPPEKVGIYPPLRTGGPTSRPTDYAIEIRTSPATQPTLLSSQQVLPLLRLRSALGVMMHADAFEYTKFLEDNKRNRAYWQYDFGDPRKLPTHLVEYGPPEKVDDHEAADGYEYMPGATGVTDKKRGRPLFSEPFDLPNNAAPATAPGQSLSTQKFIGVMSRRMNLTGFQIARQTETVSGDNKKSTTAEVIIRHYIGIFCSNEPPSVETYACVKYHSRFYYIKKWDVMSEQNFELISELISMQAVATSSPPPAPTINVGGH